MLFGARFTFVMFTETGHVMALLTEPVEAMTEPPVVVMIDPVGPMTPNPCDCDRSAGRFVLTSVMAFSLGTFVIMLPMLLLAEMFGPATPEMVDKVEFLLMVASPRGTCIFPIETWICIGSDWRFPTTDVAGPTLVNLEPPVAAGEEEEAVGTPAAAAAADRS